VRRVEVDPNVVCRKRKHLVFALELRGRLTSRAQRLLVGATISLLFVEKHLSVNVFYLQSHRSSERNAYCGSYPANSHRGLPSEGSPAVPRGRRRAGGRKSVSRSQNGPSNAAVRWLDQGRATGEGRRRVDTSQSSMGDHPRVGSARSAGRSNDRSRPQRTPSRSRCTETGSSWARWLALAPARRLEVAPLRVGWCVWLIFSDWGLRRRLV